MFLNLFPPAAHFGTFSKFQAHLATIRCSLKNKSLHFVSVSNLLISRCGPQNRAWLAGFGLWDASLTPLV